MVHKLQDTQGQCEEQGEHVGAYLKRVRDRAGLSLEAVSENLKIQPSYLSAIENLDKQKLPSLGYVLGFVRSYAAHLGLDETDAVARYKQDIECPRNMGMRDRPHYVPKRKLQLPKGSFAITTVLGGVLVLVSWYGSQSDARSAHMVAQMVEKPQDWGFETRKPTHDDPDVMSLKAIGTSWVEVRDANGVVLISRIMVPGEIFETRKQNGPVLSLRDAGAIEFFIGGTSVGLIGEKGESASHIKLSDIGNTASASLSSSVATAQ